MYTKAEPQTIIYTFRMKIIIQLLGTVETI